MSKIFSILLVCLLISFSAQAQKVLVSKLKFENFKSYEEFGISKDDIKKQIVTFSKENKEVDLTGIYQLAGQLAKIYQDKGLVFHRVYVIESNPIKLRMIPGNLIKSHVRGNSLYKTQQLQNYLLPLTGKLVDSNTMKETVLQMNHLPGLDGFAYLSVGDNPGEAQLNYKVNSEKKREFYTQISNYGSESTGLYRLNSQATFNNLFKLKDQWKFGFSLNENTENWSLNSSATIFSKNYINWWGSASYQNMAIAQSLSFLDLSGWQSNVNIGVDKTWLGENNRTFKINGKVGWLKQTLDNAAGISNLDIELEEIPIDLSISFEKAKSKAYSNFKLGSQAGYFLSYQAPLELEEDYWGVINSNYSLARSVFGSSIQNGLDFNVNLNGQYALTQLPTHHRYSLSGPNKVASVLNGSVSADSAILVQSSLKYFDMNFWKVRSVVELQAQYGKGVSADTSTDDLIAFGAVLDLNLGGFNTKTKIYADENFENPKVWFELSYQFSNDAKVIKENRAR